MSVSSGWFQDNNWKRQCGYNLDLFIDTEVANSYLCSICHRVVADCHETVKCGHIFCSGCIGRALSADEQKNNKFRCPFCNTHNISPPRPSMYLNRAVGNLRVRCPFHVNGCDWEGTLSDFIIRENSKSNTPTDTTVNNASPSGHLMGCKYASVPCETCGMRILRKDLESHKVKCHSSNENIDRNAHMNTCSGNNGSSSNPSTNCDVSGLVQCRACKGSVRKEQLSHHMEFKCPERQVKCPYYHMGCLERIKLQHLSQHLKYNATTHNSMKLDDIVAKYEKMRNQFESFHRMYEELKTANCTLQKTCEELKRENLDSKQNQRLHAQALTSPAPEILLLRGSNKWEESGFFMRKYRLHQGRVCYTSLKNKCAIRWNPDLNAWLIDRRGLAFDNEASLIAYQDVPHPGEVTTNWLVYNDDLQTWVNADNYRIESFNFAELNFRIDQIAAACDNGYPFHHIYTNPCITPNNSSGNGNTNSGSNAGSGGNGGLNSGCVSGVSGVSPEHIMNPSSKENSIDFAAHQTGVGVSSSVSGSNHSKDPNTGPMRSSASGNGNGPPTSVTVSGVGSNPAGQNQSSLPTIHENMDLKQPPGLSAYGPPGMDSKGKNSLRKFKN